jgi:hypothetical protein
MNNFFNQIFKIICGGLIWIIIYRRNQWYTKIVFT